MGEPVNRKFKQSDFTDEELMLLKSIFSGADAVIQSFKEANDDTVMSNALFSLTVKLGIDDIIE